jgi:hypothetical protein
MRENRKIKAGSTVYDRINAVRMSESERRAAIHALQDAEVIADGIIWVVRKFEQLGARLFLKPSLKN